MIFIFPIIRLYQATFASDVAGSMLVVSSGGRNFRDFGSHQARTLTCPKSRCKPNRTRPAVRGCCTRHGVSWAKELTMGPPYTTSNCTSA